MTGRISRSEHAFQTLRGAILDGRFEPGAPLKNSELQEMCGVSVSPMREALTRLVAAGLVEGEHNRGYRTASLSLAELDDLVATRIDLESAALRRSIAQGDAHWEAAALSSLHIIEVLPRRKRDDPRLHDEEWEQHHMAFHRALLAGCNSPLLLQFSQMLWDKADRYRRFSLTVEAPTRDLAAEHRAILEAALARDAEAAVTLLAQHYENTASYVREALAASGT